MLMHSERIEIDFGILGVGVCQSHDGKIFFSTKQVAKTLGLPENSHFLFLERHIARLEEGERRDFQHELLKKARVTHRNQFRRRKSASLQDGSFAPKKHSPEKKNTKQAAPKKTSAKS